MKQFPDEFHKQFSAKSNPLLHKFHAFPHFSQVSPPRAIASPDLIIWQLRQGWLLLNTEAPPVTPAVPIETFTWLKSEFLRILENSGFARRPLGWGGSGGLCILFISCLYLQMMERMTMNTKQMEMVTNRTRNADIPASFTFSSFSFQMAQQ